LYDALKHVLLCLYQQLLCVRMIEFITSLSTVAVFSSDRVYYLL